MHKKWTNFWKIPDEIRAEYWQDALQKNRLSLVVICTMIFGMETFNIVRVLFLSNAGLSTLNNRIYFGLYCALWLASAVYLLLWRLLRQARPKLRWRVQYGAVLTFLLWHVAINVYDLMRNPQASVNIYITAVLGLAVFIQMPSIYSLFTYGLAYTVFMWLAGAILSDGNRLNLTITTIVALAISLTSSRHAVIQLNQKREIDQINRQLHMLLQQDPHTGLLNKTAFQQCVERQLEDIERLGSIALLIVDLDDFKFVNDRYGHPCGDYVLKEMAGRLRETFSDAAGIGRIGGDEFAIALSNAGEPSAIVSRGQALMRAFGTTRWHGKPVGAACSIGACRVCQAGASYEQIYRETDTMLYRAKRQGKGQCMVCDFSAPPAQETGTERLEAHL